MSFDDQTADREPMLNRVASQQKNHGPLLIAVAKPSVTKVFMLPGSRCRENRGAHYVRGGTATRPSRSFCSSTGIAGPGLPSWHWAIATLASTSAAPGPLL
jgi:hypothetical protein